MPSITFGDLDFLLETNDPMDRCAQVYGRLAHAQAQFDLAVALFSDWNERARAFQECSNLLRGELAAAARLRADDLHHELSALAAELDQGIPAKVQLFKEIIGQLRTALEERYPGRQFLQLFPKDDVKRLLE